jgi:hypothetical protein
MGMDVYGKNPKSEVGNYFRRNVWGWRPLWDYVSNQHPEIAELVEYGYSNDGDGLGARSSKKLAQLLMDDFTSGKAAEYVVERNKYLSELPLEECTLCNSTGIRTDSIGVQSGQPDKDLEPEVAIILGREKGWCNGCGGSGSKEPWESNYYLDEDDIVEFANFLKDCGGFEIC